MTKTDFILQAMLQMAANPKYVEIKECVDDDDNIVKYQVLNSEVIYLDAEALANEAEKRINEQVFDDERDIPVSTQECLQDISKSLDNIEEALGEINANGIIVNKDDC